MEPEEHGETGQIADAATTESSTSTATENATERTTESQPEPPDPILPEDDFWSEYEAVRAQANALSVEDFLASHAPAAQLTQVDYAPLEAIGLDAIEQLFPLSEAQRGALAQQGFVALENATVPTFALGYHEIYQGHLPLFVTSDSLLHVLHRSFDAILQDFETYALRTEMDALLSALHTALEGEIASGAIPSSMRAVADDLDVYLTVARELLTEEDIAAIGGSTHDARVDIVRAQVTALQPASLTIFGSTTPSYDFGQMKPRGHYTHSTKLSAYFRAMMWIGRTEMRLVEYEQQHPRLNREAVHAAFLLRHLLDTSGAIVHLTTIDTALRTILGEQDNMSPADVPRLAEALGITSLADLEALSDEDLLQTLLESNFGLQRIMSQIVMARNPDGLPAILPRTHLLLGQRFTIDSYVFHNVTYDRLPERRMLPSELDVHFVLGNDYAAGALRSELETYEYQNVLHELRFLVDAHPEEFWGESFYNGWLSAIRALNRFEATAPEPMRTEAWQQKVLNTQSAAWAELRHDTLLYAKQSSSSGATCEYPDVYLEPVPEFYARMVHVGRLGIDMTAVMEAAGHSVLRARSFFTNWITVMETLEAIARKELASEPLSGDEIVFLSQTVEDEIVGCGLDTFDGWYPNLFYEMGNVNDPHPIIADVHTAPTDEQGNERGWVLHAATNHPLFMIMTVPQCDGSSLAYIGPVSNYQTLLTERYERLTDEEWAKRLDEGVVPSWARDFRR